jgi:hypothetical protein
MIASSSTYLVTRAEIMTSGSIAADYERRSHHREPPFGGKNRFLGPARGDCAAVPIRSQSGRSNSVVVARPESSGAGWRYGFPLLARHPLAVYEFRYLDRLSGKWVRALAFRCAAENRRDRAIPAPPVPAPLCHLVREAPPLRADAGSGAVVRGVLSIAERHREPVALSCKALNCSEGA